MSTEPIWLLRATNHLGFTETQMVHANSMEQAIGRLPYPATRVEVVAAQKVGRNITDPENYWCNMRRKNDVCSR